MSIQSTEYIATLLKKNFPYFAKNCIYIEGKKPGEVLLFQFNSAQQYLHEQIEQMLNEVGFVRIIIVKGRQQGISTYIEMRFLHRAIFVPNSKINIISHEAISTAALFQKAKFAHGRLEGPLKPELLASSRNEMKFPNDSSYLILTAGSEESGRSQTAHYQHQSERAFFPDAEAIDAGAGQIVADEKGTEVYKESTGNGMNHFYQEVLDALAGKGKFRVVFIPWYWQTEYQSTPKLDFKRDQEEQELHKLYQLTDSQLQWRRDKIVELKSLKKFKQEYPNTLMEAFQTSSNAFYDSELVAKAMKSELQPDSFSPVVLGVDPARTGDRTVLTVRKGRKVLKIKKYDEMDSMQLSGIVSQMMKDFNVDKCFIDYGMGHGTIDRLHERGFRGVVEGVNFGGRADNEVYLNKRAEMAHGFKDWLAEGEVSLPNDQDMAADIASMPEPGQTSNGRIQFPPKDKIKKEYGRSPDILDSILLTFAYPVRSPEYAQSEVEQMYKKRLKNTSVLSVLDDFNSTKQNANIASVSLWD